MSTCTATKLEADKTCCAWTVTLSPVGLPGSGGEGIQVLTSDTTWHIETTGDDDTADGTPQLPFKTLQGAMNRAQGYRIAADVILTMQFGPGEFRIEYGSGINGVGTEIRHIDGSRIEIRGTAPTGDVARMPVRRDWSTAPNGTQGWGTGGDWGNYDLAEVSQSPAFRNRAGCMDASEAWTVSGQRDLEWQNDYTANLAAIKAAYPTQIICADDVVAFYVRSDLKTIEDIAFIAAPEDGTGSPGEFSHQWKSAILAASGYIYVRNCVAHGFPMSFRSMGYGALFLYDTTAQYSNIKVASGVAGTEEANTGFNCDRTAYLEADDCAAVGCSVRASAVFRDGMVSASRQSGSISRYGANQTITGSKVFGNAAHGVWMTDDGKVLAWSPGTEIEGNASTGIFAEHSMILLNGGVRGNLGYGIHLLAGQGKVDSSAVVAADNNGGIAPHVFASNSSDLKISRPGSDTMPADMVVEPTHEQLDVGLSHGFSWVYDANTSGKTFSSTSPRLFYDYDSLRADTCDRGGIMAFVVSAQIGSFTYLSVEKDEQDQGDGGRYIRPDNFVGFVWEQVS